MKIVALVAIVVAAVAPPGTGKGPSKDCVRFNLKGTLQTVSAASFTLKQAKKPAVKIGIDAETQVFWTGQGTLSGPAPGERAWAKGNRCGGTYTATWVLFTSK